MLIKIFHTFCAVHFHNDLIAFLVLLQFGDQSIAGGTGFIVHSHDHVAHLNTAFLCRRMLFHFTDERTHGQFFGHGRRQAVHGHTQTGLAQHAGVAALRLFVFAGRIGTVIVAQHFFDQRFGNIHRDAETDVIHRSRGIQRIGGILAGRNTLKLTQYVEHTAAGVAGVNGRVHLDHGVGGGIAAAITVIVSIFQFAVQCRHHAHRNGAGKIFAQRIADHNRPFAYLQRIAVAQHHGRQFKTANLQNGNVLVGIVTHDHGRIFLIISCHSDSQAGSIFHHMIVGQNMSVRRNHDARTRAAELFGALGGADAVTKAVTVVRSDLLVVIDAHDGVTHLCSHLCKGTGHHTLIGRGIEDPTDLFFGNHTVGTGRHHNGSQQHHHNQYRCQNAPAIRSFFHCFSSRNQNNRIISDTLSSGTVLSYQPYLNEF